MTICGASIRYKTETTRLWNIILSVISVTFGLTCYSATPSIRRVSGLRPWHTARYYDRWSVFGSNRRSHIHTQWPRNSFVDCSSLKHSNLRQIYGSAQITIFRGNSPDQRRHLIQCPLRSCILARRCILISAYPPFLDNVWRWNEWEICKPQLACMDMCRCERRSWCMNDRVPYARGIQASDTLAQVPEYHPGVDTL